MASNILVEWDDRYSIGIPLIDEQHKELLRQTNDLYAACLKSEEEARAFFKMVIHSMVEYVGVHFSTEEKMLEKIKYPDFEEHKRQHDEFVKEVLAHVQAFEEGKKLVPNNFVRFLKDWLLAHIAVSDKKYSTYIFDLKKQGTLSDLTS
jgi:hemerythrin